MRPAKLVQGAPRLSSRLPVFIHFTRYRRPGRHVASSRPSRTADQSINRHFQHGLGLATRVPSRWFAATRGTPFDTGLDLELLQEIGMLLSTPWRKEVPPVRRVDFTGVGHPSTASIRYPAALMSNLRPTQLKEPECPGPDSGSLRGRFPVWCRTYLSPLVTPTSQIVGTQGGVNVRPAKRYKTSPTAGEFICKAVTVGTHKMPSCNAVAIGVSETAWGFDVASGRPESSPGNGEQVARGSRQPAESAGRWCLVAREYAMFCLMGPQVS